MRPPLPPLSPQTRNHSLAPGILSQFKRQEVTSFPRSPNRSSPEQTFEKWKIQSCCTLSRPLTDGCSLPIPRTVTSQHWPVDWMGCRPECRQHNISNDFWDQSWLWKILACSQNSSKEEDTERGGLDEELLALFLCIVSNSARNYTKQVKERGAVSLLKANEDKFRATSGDTWPGCVELTLNST